MLPGLKSAAAIHRPSVRPEGMTKTRYSSGPEAPIVYDSPTFRTRSGGPSTQSEVQTFGGRRILGVALRGARLGPVRQGLPLPIVQHPRAAERPPFGRRGVPGGHGALLGHRRDVVGALPRLRVIQQRERRDLAGAMAFLAVLLEDGGHVAVIGGGLGAAGRRGRSRTRPRRAGSNRGPTAAARSHGHIHRAIPSERPSSMRESGRDAETESRPSHPISLLKMIVRQATPGFKNRPHHRPDPTRTGPVRTAETSGCIGPGRR